MRAVAELILVKVVVLKVETPAGLAGIAHGGVRAQGAAAGGARPGSARRRRERTGREQGAARFETHRVLQMMRQGASCVITRGAKGAGGAADSSLRSGEERWSARGVRPLAARMGCAE